MSRWGLLCLLALRRVRREPRAVVALVLLGLVACLTAATTAACVRGLDGVVQREALAGAGVGSGTIRVLATPRGDVVGVDRAVRTAAARLPGSTTVGSLSSGAYAVREADPRTRTHLVWSADMRASAVLVQGRWPRTTGEVALPETMSARLRRGPGTTLALVPLLPSQAEAGTLRVTGTYRVPDPRVPAWHDDVRGGRGVVDGDYLVVGPLLAATPDEPAMRAAADAVWRVVPDPRARLHSAQVEQAVAALQGVQGVVVDSALPGLVAQADADLATTRAAAVGPVLVLLAVAVAAATLCGLVLVELHRRGDELLAARGASRRQFVAVAALTLTALLPGAVAAALAAPWLAGRLLGKGTTVGDGLLSSTVASLATVLLVTLAGLLASRRGAERRSRTSAAVDLSVLTLAALTWSRSRGLERADALGVVGPVLGLAAAVLVTARLSQALVAVAGFAARRARGLVAPWVVWRLRRPSSTGRSTQLLVALAAAVSTLALVQVESEDAVLRLQARLAAPAPVVVTLDESAHRTPGLVEDVGARLGAPWTSVWSRRTTSSPLGDYTVVAVDPRSPVIADAPDVRIIEGRSWRAALTALRAPVRPAEAPRPADPDAVVEVSMVDLDSPGREPGAAPIGPARLLIDDGRGRRYAALIPEARSGAVTHRARLRDLVGAGADRLSEPLYVVSLQLENPAAGHLRVTTAVLRSRSGAVRSLVDGPRTLQPPEKFGGPEASWQPLGATLPVIVTRTLAQDLDVRVGGALTVDVGDEAGSVAGTVVAVADTLPGPGADGSPAALVDLESWQQRSSARPREPVPVQQVWSLADPSARPLPGPGRGGVREVTTHAATLASARGRVVPSMHRWVLLDLLAATGLMAALGIVAAAGAGARSDVRSAAVLHALGAPRRTHRLAGQVLGWAETLLGVVLGTVAGLLLAPMVVPAWRVWPQVSVVVPGWWVAGSVLVLTVLLGAGAAAAARVGVPRPATVLRTGDDR